MGKVWKGKFKMKDKKRKLTAFMLAAAMICGLISAIPVYAEESGTPAGTTFDIRVVQTNDIHARIEEDEKSGFIGMDRLAGIIQSFTSEGDGALVLDSGDTFHGQSVATVVQGESVARLIKVCGYDAMTPGNHDWSYGKDRLKELGQMSGLKMLAGNVVNEDGTPFFDEESYIKEVTKDGKTLKIGVFGVIDPAMYQKTTPSNVAGLTFTDEVAYAKQEAAKLKQEGCDVVIALSHTYDPEGLAKQVDGVNLWLCGHEHIEVNTSVTTPDGSTAYVSESGYYLTEVGLMNLDCTMDEQGQVTTTVQKTPVDYTQSLNYEKNAEVTELLDVIKAENEVVLSREVGETPVDLDGVWEHLRIDQTNLGNVVTDAYLEATGADIAFENAGGIRASVNAGTVTYGDVIGISPYGNYIITKKLTGKQIKDMLEISVEIQKKSIAANESGDWDAWPEDSGSYLQIGGITVEYNPAQDEGNRILSIKTGEKELDENQEYTVAMNNYLAVSETYPEMAAVEEAGEFSACDEALIAFFEQGKDKIAASAESRRMIQTTKKDPEEENPQDPKEPEKENPETPEKENGENSGNSKDPVGGAQTKGNTLTTSAASNKNKSEVAAKTTRSPKTADEENAGIWILLMMCGASVVVMYKKKMI